MDIVDKENIKIPNSVIIGGFTDADFDEELSDFLNKYGRISRTIKVDDLHSPYPKNAIVEYESGTALIALEPLLPYKFERPTGVPYIRALSTEYVSAVTTSATHSLISELQKIAKLSGKPFEDVLHEHLSECSQSVAGDPEPAETAFPMQETQSRPTATVTQQSQALPSDPVKVNETNLNVTESDSGKPTQPDLPCNVPKTLITHPEVQKVIVEHIVRSESPVSQASASFRLRPFSGRLPCPSHEVDFDTWRHSVELMQQDPDLSDLQCSRKISDSLVPPAANIVKHLGPQALPSAYLELLNSAFGTVEDGDELFAKFLNTLQDAGEKPSHYLHRLHTALSKALNRGGVSASEADRHLLRQFCRGCWDNALLADLQLERQKDNPPPFAELLLQLRVEEDKHVAKESRMKKHFAATRPKVSSHALAAATDTSEPILQHQITEMRTQITELQTQLTRLRAQKADQPTAPPSNVVADLKAQITELQSHLARLKPPGSPKKKPSTPQANARTKPRPKMPEQISTTLQATRNRPKPWYCFHCGEDGHIASACSNDPNPSLVADKRKQLKDKQLLWDKQNNQNSSHSLN
ncbi:zinc finger CCHC domain-containing protein 18-like [Archocentrus centrarchus]|uniref:zinc finger CCHC domain-containing protein 18-like n=1 Tax=Archocentrus centrarchus TaxID=63155 RepID=UPI0011EA3BC8|nr:zinc finger CCHC domain-containing protein 18-like [Archocentrus centrarchus]